MSTHSALTRLDYEDFLLRLYFEAEQDPLSACISRAYLDWNRTAHGLGTLSGAEVLHTVAVDTLKGAISELKSQLTRPISSDEFDLWHRTICNSLEEVYGRHGHRLYVGQAQKWVNMTLKYVYTFGETRLPGYSEAYHLCHIPLDSIIIGHLAKYGLPRISSSWSRMQDYTEYLERQIWIRRRFEQAPLDVEFLLWIGSDTGMRSLGLGGTRLKKRDRRSDGMARPQWCDRIPRQDTAKIVHCIPSTAL
jgi:hypothetical protein